MSAAELRLATCRADVLEVAALRAQAGTLHSRAREHGVLLPALGRLAATAGGLALAVRPERWLLLRPALAPGVAAAQWSARFAPAGAVVDLSAGLAVLRLAGSEAREVLRRGCRLDLDPQVFPPGRAAATVMAQVAVTLAALPGALLLLSPVSTAQHLREWLCSAGVPFGLATAPDVTVDALSGDQIS